VADRCTVVDGGFSVSDRPQQIVGVITGYSKTVIAVMLVATLVMGAGIPMVDQEADTEQFEAESPATEAQEFIAANFTVIEEDEDEPGFASIVQIVQRAEEGENALSQESLVASLELQQAVLENENVSQTLDRERPVFGVANLLADAALAGEMPGEEQSGDELPTIEDHIATIEAQIDTLAALSEEELESLIAATLTEEAGAEVLALLPESYEPGSTEATAQAMFITQSVGDTAVDEPGGVGTSVTDAQLEIRDIAMAQDEQYSVFSAGIIGDEIDRSLGDSFAIVGPLALLFVVVALALGYRDLLDIILGISGVVAVLVWLFGFMGWTGIAFNQLILAVPVLLIGLSIDYAIHVFMRHREHRASEGDDRDLRGSMTFALIGVGVALVWVTVTAAIGFLANIISPIGPLQDFGIVAAFGVVAALLIFGALIPALKVELDELLERVGLDRRKRAVGTGGRYVSAMLASGGTAARRAPWAVIVVALLLTLGGAYGATQVETSFTEEDFLADSPPEWTQQLPEPFAPGTYQIKDDLQFIQENFQPEGSEADLLIRGEVTDDETLQWIQNGTDSLAEKETVFILPTGEADVQSPLTVMQQTAAVNDEFAAAFAGADTTGDEIPDSDIEALYDGVLTANPAASEVIYRSDDRGYEALRLTVEIRGDADINQAADDLRAVSEEIEEVSGGALTVQATGNQVIFSDVEAELLNTVLQGLLLTLGAVFLFMALAYPLAGKPASLGIVTMVPVVLAVLWILGSMWLLDIPFNILTGTITSLTVGLGIAYSIHVSARYQLELRRQGDVWDAMHTTLTGTGGALVGSAATTVGAFGTLAFAIFPLLQQFGIITGLTIIYAFLASVLVLPSLLVLWTRYLGPSRYFPPHERGESP